MQGGWRAYALDGALLAFHPATGRNVRFDGPATRHLRRTAPRVVMFGITNACNLACEFCSRDAGAPSRWTVDDAAAILGDLARAGVLEVAFGGGEPFAFRGFDELLQRLHAETPLALNVTTNGTLLTAARLAALRGVVGELRLSIYEDQPWREAVALLATSGVRWGVNLMVTPMLLAALPARLAELAALGCTSVALLAYVGPDPALHLDAAGDAALAAIAAASPVPAKVSVCFGARMPTLPRLFAGPDGDGDCGAGRDFVTITPDRMLKACSFQDAGMPIASADDVLRLWRLRQDALAAPAPRLGCARDAWAPAPPLADGVRVWRAFSGNNSGECILVGRFDEVAGAEAFLAELLPGFVAGERLSDAWHALFTSVGLKAEMYGPMPDALFGAGRTVIAQTDMDVGDAFPELRALLWKRGGRAVYNGIHVHDEGQLIVGVRPRDPSRLDRVEEAVWMIEGKTTAQRHGDLVFGAVPYGVDAPARWRELQAIAAAHDAALSVDLVESDERPPLALALARLATVQPGVVEHMWIYLPDEAAAQALQQQLGDQHGRVSRVQRGMLVEGAHLRPRVGWLAHQRGGIATALGTGPVRFGIGLRDPADDEDAAPANQRQRPDVTPQRREEFVALLRDHLRQALVGSGGDVTVELGTAGYNGWATGSLHTDAPAHVVRGLASFLAGRDLELWVGAVTPSDPLLAALARIRSDL